MKRGPQHRYRHSWCIHCDHALVSEGERCPYCKKKVLRYKNLPKEDFKDITEW